ncbi:hypothetical protein CFAM422_007725 [Trichoderma lentiforme]|uniref:Secreted protein n=1 Tax=Trichoderma lentiforme TaxID=1567552 RepID=A0A9P4XDW7_9HYPO|nr:hypothetical protein CFAM422_007725 [Trichoderma lentiforme]
MIAMMMLAPAIVVSGISLVLEVVALVDDGLLVGGVAGKVVVEAAVAGDVSRDEELLAGGQVAGAEGLVVGVAPGPGRELVDEVVAGSDELFGGDLAGVAEGRGVRDGGVAIPQRVDC